MGTDRWVSASRKKGDVQVLAGQPLAGGFVMVAKAIFSSIVFKK
jgi:hypothetical protein